MTYLATNRQPIFMVPYTATEDVAAGAFVVEGDLRGYAPLDIDFSENPLGQLIIIGRAEVVKNAGEAWTRGQKTYYDSGNAEFTSVSTGNEYAGLSANVAASAATAAEIIVNGVTLNDGGSVTPGTVEASKYVVVDANKDISAFRTLGLVNLDAGSSGVLGSIDIFPTTASRGKFSLACTNQTGDTAVTINANAMGQATTINIADPGASASYVVQSTAAITLAEADVLDGATAGATVASKVLVVDADRAITNLGAISADGKLEVSSTIAGGASPLHLVQQTNVAGDTYSGTNAILVKNYDADATVVHDGGENGGLAVYIKALSAATNGGEHVIATFHNHASTTAVVKYGIVVYGDLTNGISLSGGTSTNGIYMENQTNTNEIMFSNGTVLITGAETTRSAVRGDGGDAAAIGSQYNSSVGKIYFKVADTTADSDWELVTTTAAD